MKNKKKILIISIVTMCILLIGVLLINDNSRNNKELKEEINETKSKSFAIMLQNESGGYVESDSASFPSSGYELNTTLTNCTDENGSIVENVISYEDGNVAVETSKKVYCYLYFDKNYEQLVNYTMLYDYGDECIDVTGGWGLQYGKGNYTFNKNTNNIYIASSYMNGIPYISTINKILLEDYSILGIYSNTTSTASIIEDAYAAVGINSFVRGADTVFWASDILQVTLNKGLKITSQEVHSTESGYIHIFGNKPNNNSFSWSQTMYACWLGKKDNYSELLNKLQNSVVYDNLNELLLDKTIVNEILSNKDAVKYMIYNCTGDFMINAIQSDTFLTALESSPYKDLVYENEHWAKFLAMAQS